MNLRQASLLIILSIALLACPITPVTAHRFNLSQSIPAGDYYEVHETLFNGSYIVGNFSLTYDSYDIYFFICNSSNFQEWSAGNVSTIGVDAFLKTLSWTRDFNFTVPYDDT